MPSKPKTDIRRAANASSRHIRVLLSQINADATKQYCHRQPEALKPDRLQPLADNLVTEGQQTPITVYDSGAIGADGRPVYTLVGGFRRFHALREADRQNLDKDRIHEAMELDAIEVVRGAAQSEHDFQRDLLIRSVAENEQRVNFTTAEKLQIVMQFREQKVPLPRAASALGISDTQYNRFVAVVSHTWLHDFVVGDCIGMTDAAELILLAEKHDWVVEFREDLDFWVSEQRARIDEERRGQAKVGKNLAGSAEHVKKHATKKVVNHWRSLIKSRRRFGSKPEFQFGIAFDPEKGTITVPGHVLKSGELAAADVETLIGELQDAVEVMVPLLREKRIAEEARDLSDEEKAAELLRIKEARRRRKVEKAAAEAGRPAPGFGEVRATNPTPVIVEDEESNDVDSDDADGNDDDVDRHDDDADHHNVGTDGGSR